MRRPILSSLACVVALALAAPAFAASSSVDQTGGTLTLVRQSSTKTTVVTRQIPPGQYEEVAARMEKRAAVVARGGLWGQLARKCGMPVSTGNTVSVSQYGDANAVGVKQVGVNNAAAVAQSGNGNISYTTQYGTAHTASTTQTGDNNISFVVQTCR